MKYIMLDEKIPIIFPEHFHHKDIAAGMAAVFGTDVTSAGHVRFELFAGEVFVNISGKSNGLNMYPMNADSFIIEQENEKPNES